VQRQYTGTAGRIENAQVSMFELADVRVVCEEHVRLDPAKGNLYQRTAAQKSERELQVLHGAS
jgi:SRSO17 transposase